MNNPIPDWVTKVLAPTENARDCIAFCRDFYLSIRALPDTLRLEAYDSIMNFGFQGIIPEKGTIGELAVQMIENKIDLNFGQSSNMFEQNSDDIYNNNNITNHNDDYNNNDIKKEKRKYKKKKESFVFDQKKFDRFWSSYGRKEGKSMCEDLWSKLTDEDIDKILLTVDAYVRWKHEIKYRKMPATYLRQRAWEDSIPSEFLSAQNNQETSKYQLPHGAVY